MVQVPVVQFSIQRITNKRYGWMDEWLGGWMGGWLWMRDMKNMFKTNELIQNQLPLGGKKACNCISEIISK
jgi:hypothetical protein